MSFSHADLRGLLKVMLISRAGDLREQSLIRQGKGWFHVAGMGHEALAAIGRELRPEDYCCPYYRDRALMLMRGVTTYDLALAFYAKLASSSGGRQMPQHYSDRKLNIWSLPSTVVANFLPGCGIAWGLKMDGKPGIVLASCGDAATRQGEFFEALSFAKEKQLPVLFLVEDNGLGISSVTDKINPLAIGVLNRSDWVEVDGTDVIAVHDAAKKAVASIRAGNGPGFLWCRTERMHSHSSADDHRKYRDAQELDSLSLRDPIVRLKNTLIAAKALTEAEFDQFKEEADAQVRAEYTRAEREVDPDSGDLMSEIYGPATALTDLKMNLGEKTRMVDAINGVFNAALASDRKYLFFGQDIEDPKGGVFSLTKGLSTKYPQNVFNSPLAEATILGIACGLASYGKVPVFEIQFVDFIQPGWSQLMTNIAGLRWRTNGEWTCPCVIYAPYGAYLPGGGLMHSQANESVMAHFPGLKVVVPSTAEDIAGLFWSAMNGQDPVVVLIPKHLLWHERPLIEPPMAVPIGKARTVRTGRDVTVVAWGNCIEVAEEAIKTIGTDAEVELIDLRSIVPLDYTAIADSVRKTRRIVIVQEDNENCSVGQMLISRLCADLAVWEVLIARPLLVSKPNVGIGFHPNYEYAAIPDTARLVSALRDVLSTKEAPLVARLHAGLSSVLSVVGREVAGRSDEPVANSRTLGTGHSQPITTMFSEAPPQSRKELKPLLVPLLGEGITNAKLITLFKKPGDLVSADDPICEVETDKALFPVEAPFSGVFHRWLVDAEEQVDVGQKIALIEIETEGLAPTPVARPAAPTAAQSAAKVEQERRVSSPTEGGLAPHIVNQLKNVVATHMTVVAGWENIRIVREQAKKKLGANAPTPTVILAWSIVKAMEKHPIFCCTINVHDNLSPQAEFDFGVAVSLQNDALETAVIPKAARLNWTEFNQVYHQAVTNVRTGKGGSKARTPLILTSMGGFNVRFALPVVVPPAIATLFVGEAYMEIVPGSNTQREIINMCLSFDHRWINGVAGAAFLSDVKKNMETFVLP